MAERTCCFFGHREIKETDELKNRVYKVIEKMIVDEKADTFLFGSRSQFDSLCLSIVTMLKEKYTHIKRVYVRAEFAIISEEYKSYLLKSYDDTFYPESIVGAGKAAYIERNFEMIRNSRYCIVYYDDFGTHNRKSGTEIALKYALKQGKEITNCCQS